MNAATAALCAAALALAQACGDSAGPAVLDVPPGLDLPALAGPGENPPALARLLERLHANARARPADARARAELALAFEANGRWAEAVPHYEAAQALEPSEPLWGLHAALCEAESGAHERARARLEALVPRHPACAPLVQRLGIAQWEAGDFARARATFQALAQLSEGALAGCTGQAEVELACDAPEPALAAAERALALDPTDTLARFLRATALRELGRGALAEREFAAAGIARRRLIGDAWSARGAQFAVGFEARFAAAAKLLDGGRSADARTALLELVRERPADVRALANLAMAHAACGAFDEALAACDAALVQDSGSAALHGARAQVLLGARRPTEAAQAARRACELAPESARGFALLARALAALGDLAGARAALEEALRLEPGDPAPVAGLEGLRK